MRRNHHYVLKQVNPNLGNGMYPSSFHSSTNPHDDKQQHYKCARQQARIVSRNTHWDSRGSISNVIYSQSMFGQFMTTCRVKCSGGDNNMESKQPKTMHKRLSRAYTTHFSCGNSPFLPTGDLFLPRIKFQSQYFL